MSKNDWKINYDWTDLKDHPVETKTPEDNTLSNTLSLLDSDKSNVTFLNLIKKDQTISEVK